MLPLQIFILSSIYASLIGSLLALIGSLYAYREWRMVSMIYWTVAWAGLLIYSFLFSLLFEGVFEGVLLQKIFVLDAILAVVSTVLLATSFKLSRQGYIPTYYAVYWTGIGFSSVLIISADLVTVSTNPLQADYREPLVANVLVALAVFATLEFATSAVSLKKRKIRPRNIKYARSYILGVVLVVLGVIAASLSNLGVVPKGTRFFFFASAGPLIIALIIRRPLLLLEGEKTPVRLIILHNNSPCIDLVHKEMKLFPSREIISGGIMGVINILRGIIPDDAEKDANNSVVTTHEIHPWYFIYSSYRLLQAILITPAISEPYIQATRYLPVRAYQKIGRALDDLELSPKLLTILLKPIIESVFANLDIEDFVEAPLSEA